METMKAGFITQILRNDNIGIIVEIETKTQWIFFLDKLTKEQKRDFKVHSEVSFQRDNNFEQFVAINMSVKNNNSYEYVV